MTVDWIQVLTVLVGVYAAVIRSFSINYETNLVVYDEAITTELEADFERDIDSCVEFSVSDYDAQPGRRRLVNSAMRLCSPLL